jgi:hypothetical protein
LTDLIGVVGALAGTFRHVVLLGWRQVDTSAPRLRKADGDRLLGRTRAVFARLIFLISSCMNSPACVLGDLPSRLSRWAFSMVFLSGISVLHAVPRFEKRPHLITCHQIAILHHRLLLILSSKCHRAHLAFRFLEHRMRLAIGMQEFTPFAPVIAPLAEGNVVVYFGNGGQVKAGPVPMLKQVPCKIINVKPLHHEYD